MLKKPYFWIILWLIILSLGPITVFKDTPWSMAIGKHSILINFFQRIVALLAFAMIFFQIVLGSFMPRFIEKFGGWVFKFHLSEGILAYALILTHPIIFLIYNYFSRHIIDPFYIFTDFCLLCREPQELFYTFGRIAFWLVSIAVLAGIVRAQPWWKKHWRKFHILNYFVFFFVAIHSWFAGSDVIFPPFVYFFWVAVTLVSLISVYKLRDFLSSWLGSK